MTTRGGSRRWVLTGTIALIAAGVGMFVWQRAESSSTPSPPGAAPAEPARTLPPAEQLRLHAGASQDAAGALLDPDAGAWAKAPATAVLLNRTPRIYQTEPPADRPAPACEARALRSGGKLALRLTWDDATRNAPEPPPARTGEGGDPKQLYKRPTGATGAFPDAAAVMVPERWAGPAFPSLLMGDAHNPARLYYWSASRGAAVLTASGRATPQPTGESFPHRAGHAAGRWTVTLEMPEPADGYPLAFAVWDGEHGDRDGLKFFSVWYALTRPTE